MAGRKAKVGIDFFPIEISIFSDIKIRRLIRECGGQSIVVYLCLLTIIYREGYFIKWFKDLIFLISEDVKLEEPYVKKVIESCFDLGLLSKELFEKFNILTSKGIQDRYSTIVKNLNRTTTSITQYSLISSEEMHKTSEEMHKTSEEMHKTSEEMQQRKENNTKPNNSKENENPFIADNFSFNLSDSIQLEKILLEASEWISDVIKSTYSKNNIIITEHGLKKYIPIFIQDARSGVKFPLTLDGAKEYFKNWLPKNYKEENERASFTINQE